MNVRNTMMSQLRGRREGFSLPRPFYTDQDYYRVDMETIFYKDWVFAGHDCEISTVGQYFTLKVGDYPVVVLRDPNGDVRAFHNSCRHRGSRVCTTEHGKARRL